jgi:arylsulfatase A-like enzyme
VCLNTLDIMPTLLSLLGLPVPGEVERMDTSPYAVGRSGPEPEAAFLQGMGTTAAWRDGHEWRALRDKQYAYAVYRVDGRELLFDHRADPYQMHNLVTEGCTDVLARCRAMLKKRMTALKDTFEVCTWYRDHWTEDRVVVRTATM